MSFQIVDDITDVEVIAKGNGNRVLPRLRDAYGGKNWRKIKGIPGSNYRTGGYIVPKSTGTKLTGSGGKSTRSKSSSTSQPGAIRAGGVLGGRYRASKASTGVKKTVSYLVCVEKDEDSGDIQVARLYRPLPDKAAAGAGYVRVIDDSGEDYLYPASYFEKARLPAKAADRVELYWKQG